MPPRCLARVGPSLDAGRPEWEARAQARRKEQDRSIGDGIFGAGPAATPVDDHRELYTQVCESYRAIDDFRMKLLGLLPVATGAGVLVLLNNGKVNLGAKGQELERIQQVLAGVAIFGVAITLGLFAYELHGIKKCGRLIKIGARIERDMGTSGRFLGQFSTRPHRVAGFLDVPFASSVVYPAAVAVWVFVGLVSLSGSVAVAASGGALIVLVLLSVMACRALDRKLDAWDRAQEQTRKFLDAMQGAKNPGMVRFGPPLRTHDGWAIDPPQSAKEDPHTNEQSRRVAVFLGSDGDWWRRKNGRFKRLGDAPTKLAPDRVDELLGKVLSNHDLQWHIQEERPRSTA